MLHPAIPADGQNPSFTEIFNEWNGLLIAKDTFLVNIFDQACPIRDINDFFRTNRIILRIFIWRPYDLRFSSNFKSELFDESLHNLSAIKEGR